LNIQKKYYIQCVNYYYGFGWGISCYAVARTGKIAIFLMLFWTQAIFEKDKATTPEFLRVEQVASKDAT
jgi:hypothetical protein